jgi:hypothetical protein
MNAAAPCRSVHRVAFSPTSVGRYVDARSAIS